jgi:hypothetical protein
MSDIERLEDDQQIKVFCFWGMCGRLNAARKMAPLRETAPIAGSAYAVCLAAAWPDISHRASACD